MPQTIAFVGLAISAIGTGVQYMSARRQARQMARINKINQKIAKDKATDLQRQRAEGLTKTIKSLEQKRERIRRMSATQRQQYAMSGVKTTEGSSFDVMVEEMTNARLALNADKRTMFENLYSFDQAIKQTTDQAHLSNLQAEMKIGALKAQATSTLLQGIGSMATMGAQAYGGMSAGAGAGSPAYVGDFPTTPSTMPMQQFTMPQTFAV